MSEFGLLAAKVDFVAQSLFIALFRGCCEGYLDCPKVAALHLLASRPTGPAARPFIQA